MNMFPRPKISDDKFERSNHDNLFEACFRTLWKYQTEGKEPGAEHWQADTRWKRPILMEDIRVAWLSIVGGDWLFPWHEDYVTDCFVSLRKATNPKKAACCEHYGMATPAKWRQPDAEEPRCNQ